jgi:hypothetical protein
MIKTTSKEDGRADFPKLMRGPSAAIILFTNKSEGTILFEGGSSEWEVGEFYTDLDTYCCVDYKGTLEMSNE